MPAITFVDLPLTTDPTALANEATDLLQAWFIGQGLSDWQPNAVNLEIMQIQILAAMFNEIAVLAAQVPASVFRNFGTQLFNVPYQNAVAATANVVFTLTDDAGHTIPGGTFVSIDGEGFYTTADVDVPNGQSSVQITMPAVDVGSAYNGLGAATALIDAISFVSAVTTSGVSSGGVDAETDSDYQDRLATELTLQAPRPITANDYAVFVLSFSPADGTDQQLVGRATAIDGFSPDSETFNLTFTSSSPTITIVSGPGPFAVPAVGATVTGTGISGTVLASPAPTSSEFTLSADPSGSHTNEACTVSSSYYNERTVGVFVTDVNGDALNEDTLTAIQAWLAGGTVEDVVYPGYREINFIVNVMSPTYVQMSIAYEIHALPGFGSANVIANVNAALAAYLDPASWGSQLPGALDPTWYSSALGFGTVRINKLIGIVEAVPGVDYVLTGTMTLGTAPGSPVGTTDVAMVGPAPLPLVEYPDFDPVATYVTDDQVQYLGETYYSTAGSSPGAWDGSDWTLIEANPATVNGNAVSIWGSADN
jgi:hypothetical protein